MKAVVVYNRELSPGYYRLRVRCPSVAEEARPGTFLTLRVTDMYEPLLRRPFSIYNYDREKGTVDIVYKVVGVGTWLMSEIREGKRLDVLGPMGNGFGIAENDKMFVLVAGGVGVAALYALASSVSTEGEDIKITLLMGGAKENDIICIDDFKKLGAKVLVSTEDGSMGKKGLVTDLLKEQLDGPLGDCDLSLYSCGPKEMLREMAHIAEQRSLTCKVSLEGRMGCGIGACLGCVIKVLPRVIDVGKTPVPVYKRICRDGPVFDAAEIDWDAL